MRHRLALVRLGPLYEVVLHQRMISGHRGIHCHGVGLRREA